MMGLAIMGLIDPPGYISDGRILLGEDRIDPNPAAFRGSGVSMIFQDPQTSLNPLRSIGSQLVETIERHNKVSRSEAIAQAHRALEEVNINSDRFHAYPHVLSGGMRQRVVIALALACDPKLIIADEPTTALDVTVQAQILDLLKSLCRARETSVLLITHDMGVIAKTADRVAVLYAGRLAEIGPTSDVLGQPKHPYTQGLMASTPKIDPGNVDRKLHQIHGAMPRLDSLPSGCAFHPRCDVAVEKCHSQQPPLWRERASCWHLEKMEPPS